MKFIGLIPARYASTRFPGKPLAMLGGKPVIQRVYEQVSTVMDKVYVCTDDERIRKTVEEFGGKVVMTSTEHRSGTDCKNTDNGFLCVCLANKPDTDRTVGNHCDDAHDTL